MRSILALCFITTFASHAICADIIRVGGTGSSAAFLASVAADFTAAHPGIEVRVLPSLGSSGSIQAVAAHAADIAITARPLQPEEASLGLSERRWGLTPLVFVVQPQSRVREVTTEQLIGIYAGSLTSWSDGQRIRLVLRPRTDTEDRLITQLLPAVEPSLAEAHVRPGIPTGVTDDDAANLLESIPGAFGISTLALIKSEKRHLVPVALDGEPPSLAAALEGRYRMVKPLLIVARRDEFHANPFIDFLTSEEVRHKAEENGIHLE